MSDPSLTKNPVSYPAVLLPAGSFEMVPVAELLKKRHPSNNNKHPKSQIKAYIKILRAGIRQPVVVSRQTGLILKGHGALESALQAGWTHWPVQIQDFDSEEAELSFLLADNQLASLSKTDETTTAGVLARLKASPAFDAALTGFSQSKINSMLAAMKENAPAKPAKPAVLKLPLDPRWEAAASAEGKAVADWVEAVLCRAVETV